MPGPRRSGGGDNDGGNGGGNGGPGENEGAPGDDGSRCRDCGVPDLGGFGGGGDDDDKGDKNEGSGGKDSPYRNSKDNEITGATMSGR